MPARIALLAGLSPVGYDTRERDLALGVVGQRVASDGGRLLVLLGDSKVTDQEPAYRELSAGLIDAHGAVGIGSGSTWRPAVADFLAFAILRLRLY